MAEVQTLNSIDEMPDMNVIAQSIKTINRQVLKAADGIYSYFADSMKMSSVVSNKLKNQITDALTRLPTSLENLKSIEAFAANIEKINAAEKAGKIDANRADIRRKQLAGKLNQEVSSVVSTFDDNVAELSESVARLSKYSDTISVRIKDSLTTEESNQRRAKADIERESARLTALEEKLAELNTAVDERRGGPADELIDLMPDEEALSSLLDANAVSSEAETAEAAAEASAAELAAAKTAMKLAVAEVKKVLKVVGDTVEFTQLTMVRDEIFKASEAQRKIVNATTERYKLASSTLEELTNIKVTSNAMATIGVDVNKMLATFSSFTATIKNLDGEHIDQKILISLFTSMKDYLNQVRKAHNDVILA